MTPRDVSYIAAQLQNLSMLLQFETRQKEPLEIHITPKAFAVLQARLPRELIIQQVRPGIRSNEIILGGALIVGDLA